MQLADDAIVGDLVMQIYTKRMYIVLDIVYEANVRVAFLVDFDGRRSASAAYKLIKVNKNT